MHKLLTVKEAAEILNVSGETVRRLLKRKELVGRKIGKLWRVNREDIDNFVGGPKND